MSTTKPSIRSIYVGKPDAKDEVLSAGNDAFIKSFILPDNFTANSFLASDNCYITGYKGTGKTAILLYLQSQTSLDKGTQRKTTENELPSLTQCTA